MQNRYPLWKNLMLVVIAFVGLIYAIPNLYSEDPVVQISSDGQQSSDELASRVSAVLKKDKVPYRKMSATDDGLEIWFDSTDAQLLAQDAIKRELGTKYTVALNLVPSTPNWLRAIGASPMKQGLDLRGGVHFLLEVDIDSVINRRYEGFTKSIGQDLREHSIRYSAIRYKSDKGIEIRFRNRDSLDASIADLRAKYPSLTFTKISADNAVIASLAEVELQAVRQNTIEQTMSILRNRVNELGVGESVVQQQGATRIAVDLPGIQDAARAKQILGGTATLQFHLVDLSCYTCLQLHYFTNLGPIFSCLV